MKKTSSTLKDELKFISESGKQKKYLLPSELSIKVMQLRLWREYQVWIMLKSICDGHLLLNGQKREFIAKSMGVSSRTIERTIKKLIIRNWLGFDNKSKYFYPRSIDMVSQIELIRPKHAYWFYIHNIKEIKGFCMASAITNLIRTQKRKNSRRSATKERRHFKPLTYFPVSLTSLEAIYGIGKRNASVLRSLSSPKYLNIRAHLEPLIINGVHQRCGQINSLRAYFWQAVASKIICKKR